MNKPSTEKELDEFNTWLKGKLPQTIDCPPPSAPSQKLLDLAWEASKENNLYCIQNGLAFSQYITPMAASDGGQSSTVMRFKCKMPQSIGNGWSLIHEEIPKDPDRLYMIFKCDQDLIETVFKGREVKVRIGNEHFNLGKVSKRGIAETKIPKKLDYQQEIEVYFSKW